MDRTNMFDEYVKENEDNRKALTDSEYYLDALDARITGSKSIAEVKEEVNQFLTKNEVPSSIREELLRICDGFASDMDAQTAIGQLKEYMQSLVDEQKEDFQKSDDEVNQIKSDFVDDSIRQLEESGVTVVGDTDDLIAGIHDQRDIERMQNNIDTAVDYMDEKAKLLREDTPSPEIHVDQIQDSLEASGDETVLTAINEDEDREMTSTSSMSFSDDGIAYCYADKNDDVTMQFALMMMGSLMLTQKDQELFQNLGLKLVKDQNNDDAFRLEAGNFPVTNHPENRLSALAMDQIQKVAHEFQPGVDYHQSLLQEAPEIALMFQIFDQHILGNEGDAILGIKRADDHFHFSLSVDENYQQVAEAFRTNNAITNETPTGKNLISVSKETMAEQLVLLQDTEATLLSMEEELSQANELNNTRGAYVKTLTPPPVSAPSSSQSGQVSPVILGVVVALEVAAVLISIFFIF